MKPIELENVLCCPSCRQTLRISNASFSCPSCHKEGTIDNRLVDFSELTPTLPLDLNKKIKKLTEEAGILMKDVPVDWRAKNSLNIIKSITNCGVCLEIGGADGPMTPSLEKHFDMTLSLDYSKGFLKRIEDKTERTICLFGDAHFLPLNDDVIDIVICTEVLEHATIPTQLLTEIRRVTKENGIIFLTVPNETSSKFFKRTLSNLPALDTHINFFTPDTISKLLFRVGLEILDIKTILPPIESMRTLLNNILLYLTNGFYGQYIQCVLKPMKDPFIYWESFFNKINKSNNIKS